MTNAQALQNLAVLFAAGRVDSAGVFESNNGGFRGTGAGHTVTGRYVFTLTRPMSRLRCHLTVSVEGSGALVGWDADTSLVNDASPRVTVYLTDSTNAGVDATFSLTVEHY